MSVRGAKVFRIGETGARGCVYRAGRAGQSLEVGGSTDVGESGSDEAGSGGARVLVLGKAREVAYVIEVVEDGRWWKIFGSGKVVVGKDVA